MLTTPLPGYAPTVGLLNGLVYVGSTVDDGSYLHVFTPSGSLVSKRFLPDASYLDIRGVWAGFKQAPAFQPCALHLLTGEVRAFTGVVGGDPGVVISEDGNEIAWQRQVTTADGPAYEVWASPLSQDAPRLIGLVGAPDGLDSFNGAAVVCRKDLRVTAPEVGGYVQRAGALRVGQYGFGIGVRFDDWKDTHWLLGGIETKDPRCATNGTDYAIVSWGSHGTALVIATRGDLSALPLPPGDAPPVDPPPPPAHVPAGTVTIASYDPSTLFAGGTVTAQGRVTGDVTRVEWLTSSDGKTWTGATSMPASPAPSFVFRFAVPGTYVIGLRGLSASGQLLDQTGMTRLVTVRPVVVVDPPIDPPPDPPRVFAPPTTARTTFMVGTCWPNDLTGGGAPNAYGCRRIRLLGLNCLRIGLSHLNPHWQEDLALVIAHDLWPLVIVDIHQMDTFEQELLDLEAFVEVLLRVAPWLPFLEMANEPSGRFSVDQYVRFVQRITAVRDRVGSSTVLLAAAETHDFGTGAAHPFWSAVKARLGTVEAAAIHPYRNPKPWHWSAFGSREAEWAAIKAASASRLLVTETGWHDGEDQAVNLVNELDLLRSFGCELVCIYAYVTGPGDFGLFQALPDQPWNVGPGAAALAHYLQEHPL